MKVFMLLSFLFYFLFLNDVEIKSVQDLEKMSMADRNKIKQIYFKLECKLSIVSKPQDTNDGIVKSDYEIWDDGKRIRSDCLKTGKTVEKYRNGILFTQAKNFDGAGTSVIFSQDTAAYIATKRDKIQKLNLNDLFDPRALGAVPSTVHFIAQMEAHFSCYFSGEKDDNKKFSVVNENKKKLYVIEWTTKNGIIKSVIDPELNYNPIRIETQFTLDSLQKTSQLTCEYQLTDNIYFPKKYKVVRKKSDINVTSETIEEGIISDLIINKPIASSVFTFEGMGMKPGHAILNSDKEKDNVYEFKPKEVPKETIRKKEVAPVALDEGKQSNSKIFWLVVAILSSFVAFIILYILFIQRK